MPSRNPAPLHPTKRLPKYLRGTFEKLLQAYLVTPESWLCIVLCSVLDAQQITLAQATAAERFIIESLDGCTFLTDFARRTHKFAASIDAQQRRQLRIDWLEWLLNPENQK